MEIRRAQPAEAEVLTKIAQSAKASWGYPATWLRQWHDLLTITPQFIEANETFVANIESEIVAFYALLLQDATLRLEHLWVAPGHMRHGLGQKLFAHAVERARSRGAPRLTIEADPNAEAFYRHMGAVRIGAITTQIEGEVRELPLLSFDLRNRLGLTESA